MNSKTTRNDRVVRRAPDAAQKEGTISKVMSAALPSEGEQLLVASRVVPIAGCLLAREHEDDQSVPNWSVPPHEHPGPAVPQQRASHGVRGEPSLGAVRLEGLPVSHHRVADDESLRPRELRRGRRRAGVDERQLRRRLAHGAEPSVRRRAEALPARLDAWEDAQGAERVPRRAAALERGRIARAQLPAADALHQRRDPGVVLGHLGHVRDRRVGDREADARGRPVS
eukprot:CAMPEP_0198495308 /NCGR_PEP_ID=MMETSP1462-20131121/5130_1 /TAXON_ID=1333877 /ORGANISM="Brandtodinium nutriculum, Strain RCC3387" /LENGTH=226 /DNA_ID=CAMNT_0044224079 /DNA_START=116 /DNA_END=792 /DNA_ORIENTATION=+